MFLTRWIVLFSCLLSLTCASTIIVSTVGNDTEACGAAANSSCATINYAITQASEGDTILVYPGEYSLNQTIVIDKTNLIIESLAGAEATILRSNCTDCRAILAENALLSINSTIKGFSVINFSSSVVLGSVYLSQGNFVVENCIFRNNRGLRGGAVYLRSSESVFINCTFQDNSAVRSGGAMHIEYIPDDTLSSTTGGNSTSDSHSSSPLGEVILDTDSYVLLQDCVFSNNIAPEGGSVSVLADWVKFARCSFVNTTIAKSDAISSYNGAIVYVNSPGLVEFDDCRFSNITVGSVTGGGVAIHVLTTTSINRCVFDTIVLNNTFSNQGGVITVSQLATVYINDCIFRDNNAGVASLGGCIFAGTYSVLHINRTVFDNNFSLFGGAMYMESETAIISYSNFSNNQATFGGAIYALGRQSNFLLYNNTVISNVAYTGGGLFAAGVIEQLLSDGSKFVNNTAYDGGGICVKNVIQLPSLFEQILRFQNTLFQDNLAHSQGGALLITSSRGDWYIIGSNFTHNFAAKGGGLCGDVVSFLMIQNTVFYKNNATTHDGGGGLWLEVSRLHINNSTFQQNSSPRFGGGGVINLLNSAEITQSLIRNNTALGGGGFFIEGVYTTIATISIVDTTFELNQVSGNHSTEESYGIENDDRIGTGGGIFALISEINATRSKFLSNKAAIGAGIALINQPSTSTIINSTFERNEASNGGGIFVLEGELDLLGTNIFRYNVAKNNGGGIAYDSEQWGKPWSANFISNTATRGGGYFMDFSLLDETHSCPHCQFVSNKASCYGPDAATTPYGLTWTKPMPPSTSSVDPMTIQVQVLDYFEQPVRCELQNIDLLVSPSGDARIYGDTLESTTENGTCVFTKLYLNGEIQTTYTLTIKATTGNYPNMNLQHNITIEPCPPGYEELVDNECTYCSAGTYNNNANGKCLPCPTGAQCVGGSEVYAAQGYWQETYDPTKLSFLLCSVKGSCCPNGFCTIENPCGPNRSGTMCSVCDPGYSQWGDSCIPCENPSWEFVYVVFVFAFLFVLWLVKYPMAYWGLTNSMLYYCQTVPLLVPTSTYLISEFLNTTNMRLDWLTRITALWGGSLCIWPLSALGVLLQPLVLPTMFLMVLFFLWACSVIYTLCRYERKEWRWRVTNNNHKYYNTLWNLGFICYLSITMMVFNILIGKTINGEFVVAAAPSMLYFSPAHIYLFVLAIVIILGFLLPFPIYGMYIVRVLFIEGAQYLQSLPEETTGVNTSQPVWMRNADTMHKAMTTEYQEFLYHPSSQAFQRHGVVYFPFKPQYHGWKMVVAITRVMLGFSYVSLKFYPAWQAMCLSFICIIKLSLQALFSPFRSPHVNVSEFLSQLCLSLLASIKIAINLHYTNLEGARVVTNFILLIPFAFIAFSLTMKYWTMCKNRRAQKKAAQVELQSLDTMADLDTVVSDTSKASSNYSETAPLLGADRF